MVIIYYFSIILFILALPTLFITFLGFLIKPGILNQYTKRPWSRKRIAGIGIVTLLGIVFIFGGIINMSMPTSVRAEIIARQKAAEEEKKTQQALMQQEAERKKQPVIKRLDVVSVLNYSSSEQEDSILAKGERKTTVSGVNGQKTDSYEVTYVEGEEVSRKLIESKVTKEPVNEIVSIGTYVAPVATPQPAMSTPSPTAPSTGASAYYANCTEARAAGVAPIYRGQPGYRAGLDRDNDDIACE